MLWLFWVYLAVVFVGKVTVFIYRRRHPTRRKHSAIGDILEGLYKWAVSTIIVFTGFMIFLVGMMIDEYYVFFTPSRCRTVEERTGIVLNENTSPIKYKRYYGGADDKTAYRLELNTDLDTDTFVEQCCPKDHKNYNDPDDILLCQYIYNGKRFRVLCIRDTIVIIGQTLDEV